jgi:primosomal protein N' (replication factor Y) (superfamily II helicase)
MEGQSFAEISVNSPIAQRRTFSYSIPAGLSVQAGQAVWAPFGAKTLQGILVELTARPAVEETRPLAGLIEAEPLVSPVRIELARWISAYYLAPLFDSLVLMLPPGFERQVDSFFARDPQAAALPPLSAEISAILTAIEKNSPVNQKKLARSFGVRRTQNAIQQLLKHKLITRHYRLAQIRIKPRYAPYLRLKASSAEAGEIIAGLPKQALRQAALLEFLVEHPGPQALAEIRRSISVDSRIIRILTEKGCLEVENIHVERDPLLNRRINLTFPLTLTQAQKAVYANIRSSLRGENPRRPQVFLLHGVTGSGKTEIYIQALEEAVQLGKKGIVLVPEIAMTPQIIERFVSRFPGRVAVLHSALSPGERFDEWWRIKKGDFDVVIGPRSALFSPQPDLGLIIMDEEHEWTYKQRDKAPRYHARRVALKLAELCGATVILGSATPDIESYSRAQKGEYQLLELPERVTPTEGAPLPHVERVDLKAELKAGNLSLFSRILRQEIESALARNEQILLFLNRRGAATSVECRNCGWVIRCKRCDVPLSYHLTGDTLICHQCNYRTPVPLICPHCRSRKIKFLGAGTENLEHETASVFPQAVRLRWDSDVVKGRGHTHQEIFEKMRTRQADILIGTQMVAKGLDLPWVTVVGVVCADIALNLPDFRAAERTFQLLSQVAGRAGRGPAGGKVVFQTYLPEHYAIQTAAGHDYPAFARKELAYRRELLYPPFSRLARLTFVHTNEARCREETERMKRVLLGETDARGVAGISLIGPAPAFIHRLRGRYRWQLTVRAPDPSALLDPVEFPRGWSIDIDPVGLD